MWMWVDESIQLCRKISQYIVYPLTLSLKEDICKVEGGEKVIHREYNFYLINNDLGSALRSNS